MQATAFITGFVMPKLLGTKDLAALLGISLRKLEQMIERGELPAHVRLGRTRKWKEDHVQQWLDGMFTEKQQCQSLTTRPTAQNAAPVLEHS